MAWLGYMPKLHQGAKVKMDVNVGHSGRNRRSRS